MKRNARLLICLVLTLMYAVGLVLMLLKKTEWGLLLWAVSTVASMGVLYLIKKRDAAQEQSKEDRGEH